MEQLLFLSAVEMQNVAVIFYPHQMCSFYVKICLKSAN